MSDLVQQLGLLQEWIDATKAGDHARALATVRSALREADATAQPELLKFFEHLETLSMATADPALRDVWAQQREDATRSAVCGFCGRTSGDGRRLIAGGGALICSECIAEAQTVLSDVAGSRGSNRIRRVVSEASSCSFCGSVELERVTAPDGGTTICARCVGRIAETSNE